jgi:rfaE bifunctional protein nucleotidyltransferase chain/domain
MLNNHKYLTTELLVKLINNLKSERRKIVFTYGTFDLIHSGHAAYLLNAKMCGDVLIVGIATNKSNAELRGKGFPLIDQKNRAELLNYFKFVDYTVLVDKQDLLPTLKKIRPDVFYTIGADWKSHLRKQEEAEYVESYGGKIVKLKKVEPFISSSSIVEKVADLKIKEIIEYFFGKIKIDLSKGNWKQSKFSGLKTSVREEALYFGDHVKELSLFSSNFFGQFVKQKDLKTLGQNLRKSGKTIVLSSGACDLIHAGHARFYKKAKELGDVLVLAIPGNKIITKQKGRGRPIVDERSRAELMMFFEFVDYIVIFNDEKIDPILEDLNPHKFFTVQEDWNENALKKTDEVQKIGNWEGMLVSVPPQSPKLSSSRLIRKAAGLRVKELFKEVLKEAENFSTIKD